MAPGSDHFVEAIVGKGVIAAHGVICSIPQASYKTPTHYPAGRLPYALTCEDVQGLTDGRFAREGI